jgi:hypothetical protein
MSKVILRNWTGQELDTDVRTVATNEKFGIEYGEYTSTNGRTVHVWRQAGETEWTDNPNAPIANRP